MNLIGYDLLELDNAQKQVCKFQLTKVVANCNLALQSLISHHSIENKQHFNNTIKSHPAIIS
jgi:hypothetical protein